MRKLGRTDLQVAPLCLGGNVFGWTADEQRSFEVLDAYMAGGGNFIDTADVYSTWVPGHVGGESEEVLGNWMRSRKNREHVIVATKLGSRMGTGPNAQGLSRRYMMEEVEASLRRLQTDYIDLYQAHRDDENTPLEETLAAFDDLVRQGKVRFIGASNYSADRLQQALRISEQRGYVRYESMQPPYNLVNRGVYEGQLEAVCVKQEVGVITYSSLASGFLSGKYRPHGEMPASPRAKGIQQRYANEGGYRVLERLDEVAAAAHATVGQVALAWVIARPGVTAAIASATTVGQLQELMGAVDLSLSDEAMAALSRS